MSQIISVHSFRHGTGKSNIVANLGVVMAARGLRVGIVDSDLQSPSIPILFKKEMADIEYSLYDFLKGNCDIKDTIIDVTRQLGPGITGQIFLVLSRTTEKGRMMGEPYDANLLHNGFQRLVTSLGLDILLVDTHASLNEETMLSMVNSDILIEVMRPDQQDFQGTPVSIDIAQNLSSSRILLVMNMVPRFLDFDAIQSMVEKIYKCEVAAILPLSEEMLVVGGSEIFALQYPDSEISLGFKQLADYILKP